PGIGAARLRTLVAAFGSAGAALHAAPAAIAALPGFSRAAAGAIRAVSPAGGHEILNQLDRIGAAVLVPDDPRFPPLLSEIPDPPALLYVWGDAAWLQRSAVGIVGSRDHTSYGADAARLLAAGVARAGVVVTSGMARGIDAIAHGAALDAGGASVGVLGNGFGVIYPAANRALYERMITAGCLVSELPPGERSEEHTSELQSLAYLVCRLLLEKKKAVPSGAIRVNRAHSPNPCAPFLVVGRPWHDLTVAAPRMRSPSAVHDDDTRSSATAGAYS